jgi:hypothetical protein
MASLQVEPTPNPNSLKFTPENGSLLDGGMVSIDSEDEADEHPLGRRLFSVPGVTNVFITPGFVTVSKQDAAEWNSLRPKVESILKEYLGG